MGKNMILKMADWFAPRSRMDRGAMLGREASASLKLEDAEVSEKLCAFCLDGDFDARVYAKMATKEKGSANPDDPWSLWKIMRDMRDAGLRRLPVLKQIAFWQKNFADFLPDRDGNPFPENPEELGNFCSWLDEWEREPGKDIASIFRMAAWAHFGIMQSHPYFHGKGFCARMLDLRIRSFLPDRLLFPMSKSILAARLSYARELNGDTESFEEWHAFRAVCGMYNQVKETNL